MFPEFAITQTAQVTYTAAPGVLANKRAHKQQHTLAIHANSITTSSALPNTFVAHTQSRCEHAQKIKVNMRIHTPTISACVFDKRSQQQQIHKESTHT